MQLAGNRPLTEFIAAGNLVNKQRLLVTGAAGFIGSRTCETLIDLGHYVRGLDSFNEVSYSNGAKVGHINRLKNMNNFEFVQCDLTETSLVQHLADMDSVVHLGAATGLKQSWNQPHEFFRSNSQGTRNLLESMNNADNFISSPCVNI